MVNIVRERCSVLKTFIQSSQALSRTGGLYVMINRYADKDGNNPCMPDGLKPDYPAEDNPLDGYQLGDENESLLRLALDRAAGKTDRSGARTVSLLPYELTPMTVNPLFGQAYRQYFNR